MTETMKLLLAWDQARADYQRLREEAIAKDQASSSTKMYMEQYEEELKDTCGPNIPERYIRVEGDIYHITQKSVRKLNIEEGKDVL